MMKVAAQISPFVLLSAVLLAIPAWQDLGSFEPLLRGLAELPLVGGMAWILLRQQDKHQETIGRIMSHFSDRSERKDQFYQSLIKDHLSLIADLSKEE